MSRKERRAHLQQDQANSKPAAEPKIFANEEVLPDDYPVYPGYCYVADGRVIRSMIAGSVRALKADIPATEIRRCNIAARDIW